MPQDKESQETPFQTTMREIFQETAGEQLETHPEFLEEFENRAAQALQEGRVTPEDFVTFHVQDKLRLEKMASRDFLTGLWAKAGFADRYDEVFRQSGFLSCVALDLDNFDLVNNELGHKMGNKVLILFANILKKVTEKTGFAVRTGGDEFLIVLPETEEEKACEVARKVIVNFSEQMDDRVRYLGVSTSAGVYTSQEGEGSKEEILERADQALVFGAKKKGKNRVCTWKPEYQPQE